MQGTVNPFGLRIPPELKEWLVRKAEDNGRSLNSEILQRLKESQRQESAPAPQAS